MIDDVRRIARWLRNLWAGIVIAVLIPVLVVRACSAAVGLIWQRRRTRKVFRRSLLRAGLTVEEVDALAERYCVKIPFRELLTLRGRFSH